MLPYSNKPLAFRIRADLFFQLEQLETAGLPVTQALTVLHLPPRFQRRVESMRKLLARGIELASAGEQSDLFTSLESRLIRAACSAGSPAHMYRRLASYYTDQALQLAAMKSRLLLPAAIFLLALLVQPLPELVVGSLSIGGYVWQVLRPMLLIGILVFFIRWLSGREARPDGKSLFRLVPLYAKVFVRQNLRDFFENLGLLLEAGMPMLQALPIALDTMQDGELRGNFSVLQPLVAKGSSLTDAMRGIGYIDDRLRQFVRTGEASGALPVMLLRFTKAESESINSYLQQLAMWIPRAIYAVLVLWVAYGLLTGGGFNPHMPE